MVVDDAQAVLDALNENLASVRALMAYSHELATQVTKLGCENLELREELAALTRRIRSLEARLN